MRTGLKVALSSIGLLAVASYASGITPNYISSAPAMLTGLGAMLTCSAKYVSGIDAVQNKKDLTTYSPFLAEVDISYDDAAKRVSATVFDMKTTYAQYRDGLGCALEIGDTSALDEIEVPAIEAAPDTLWPLGDKVAAPHAAVQQTLDDIMQADNAVGLQTRALLVAKGGKVIAESYAAGFDSDSKLIGWSMSKSFNALMVGNMEMRGLIVPSHKPVFDEWADDERATISLDDMLHMASGLDLSEVYDPGTAVTSMLFTEHSGSSVGLKVGLVNEPGTHYDYSSGTTNLLAQLVFDRAGGTVQASIDNLHQHFVQPMGLQNFVLETDPSGVFLGSSFMMASARDWARMGQLMLNGGELNDQRIVTEEWVARAVTPNHTENKRSYGYQFWLNRGDAAPRWPDLPSDAYAALGSREQVTMTIPSEDMVIVRLGWSLDSTYPTSENFARIVKATKS